MNNIYCKTLEEYTALPARFEVATIINIQFSEWMNVVARENGHVVARENSHVAAWGNSHVVARENSHVEARENSSVEAREDSHVTAWGRGHVTAWGNSYVAAWGSGNVVAWENSRVEARGSGNVVAWGNTCCHCHSSEVKVILMGFSVLFSLVKHKFIKESVQSTVIEPVPRSIFEEEIAVASGVATVYKRVSREFKTQENTSNETVWTVGKELEVPNWNPVEECGAGKFHACSRPYFCDEFRSTPGDIYIAIEVRAEDFHEFPNPQYPHKVAFRRGRVLFVCDRYGKQI